MFSKDNSRQSQRKRLYVWMWNETTHYLWQTEDLTDVNTELRRNQFVVQPAACTTCHQDLTMYFNDKANVRLTRFSEALQGTPVDVSVSGLSKIVQRDSLQTPSWLLDLQPFVSCRTTTCRAAHPSRTLDLRCSAVDFGSAFTPACVWTGRWLGLKSQLQKSSAFLDFSCLKTWTLIFILGCCNFNLNNITSTLKMQVLKSW